MSLTPKNWDSFQHYKDRSPSWIKLHRGLLDDFEFARLPVASRALAPLLWLLASEYEDGIITASMDELAFRLRMPIEDMLIAISPLIECGFFSDSTPLAACKQNSIPEREIEKQEEKEKKETRANALDDWPKDFREQFWAGYPHKVGKSEALRSLDRVRKRAVLVPWGELVEGLDNYIRTKPPDRPWCNPATWLNQDRWTDQPANVSKDDGKTGNIIAASDNLVGIIDSFSGPPRDADSLRSATGPPHVRLLSQG